MFLRKTEELQYFRGQLKVEALKETIGEMSQKKELDKTPPNLLMSLLLMRGKKWVAPKQFSQINPLYMLAEDSDTLPLDD